MEAIIEKLISAGSYANEAAVMAKLADVREEAYCELYFSRLYSLAFVADIKFPLLMRFVRALSIAEKNGLCPYQGSVSLLISVYIHSHKRRDGERAALADWIVVNHENPYTPFNVQITRAMWSEERHGSRSPLETLRRVEAREAQEERESRIRAQRHEVHTGIEQLHRGISPTSPELRERMLSEMERDILRD